jgi:hypothetical protein
MKKLAAGILVCSLVFGLTMRSALAQRAADSVAPSADKTLAPEPTKVSVARNEKLKADVTKLVADTKAGRIKMPAQQFPPPQRNNLSTGAKIAIFAGIGAAIFLIVMLASLADDDS